MIFAASDCILVQHISFIFFAIWTAGYGDLYFAILLFIMTYLSYKSAKLLTSCWNLEELWVFIIPNSQAIVLQTSL